MFLDFRVRNYLGRVGSTWIHQFSPNFVDHMDRLILRSHDPDPNDPTDPTDLRSYLRSRSECTLRILGSYDPDPDLDNIENKGTGIYEMEQLPPSHKSKFVN